MYTVKDFKAGDSVYIEVTGNAARGFPMILIVELSLLQ